MLEIFEGAGTLWDAILSGDPWTVGSALGSWTMYPIFLVLMLLGGLILLAILRLIPILDRHLERTVLIITYLVIAGVIFVEVIRRFTVGAQVPWSTTLPPYLFLIMTWVGCAYNARLRTHLSFTEVRTSLPRTGQFFCLCLDAVLWLGFALIVIVTTARQTVNSAMNFQILLGTDNVMQWWFYLCVPLSWLLLAARVMENFGDDLRRYRSGQPVIEKTALLAD